MRKERKEITELMKRLINLYEQVENVKPESSRLVVEDHINKLEDELVFEIRGDRDERA